MTYKDFRIYAVPALLISASALAGCAASQARPPVISYDDAAPAVPTPAPTPSGPVEVVTVPTPLPLPGQLKPFAPSVARSEPADPRDRVGAANAAARVQPSRDGYLNAIQQYPWTDGALYQVYTAPGQVTDIALQEGEQLVGAGPVAAGDTVRWIIDDTESGLGPTKRVHILAKPTRSDLVTNLVVGQDNQSEATRIISVHVRSSSEQRGDHICSSHCRRIEQHFLHMVLAHRSRLAIGRLRKTG